jgi:ribosome-binding ATPase YchF (GTP1/OBG family)
MSLQNEALRGDLARQVIENEVYAEAYGLIEQEITKAWRESKNPAEREELHRALRSLVKVQRVLEATMDSGKVAAEQLKLERSRAQRIGDYFKAA